MQSVSSSIWTRITVFISYEDNHYTTGTSHLEVYDHLLRIIFIISYLKSYSWVEIYNAK